VQLRANIVPATRKISVSSTDVISIAINTIVLRRSAAIAEKPRDALGHVETSLKLILYDG